MLILKADELPFQALPGIYPLGEVLLRIKAASKACTQERHATYQANYRERGRSRRRSCMQQCSTTTPTTGTTQINRIRGFSLTILEELQNSGGLRTTEIRDITGHRRDYVYRYLYNLHKYGCVSRKDIWGWEITSLGIYILSSYTTTIDEERRRKEEGKKEERRRKENNPRIVKTSRQINLDIFSSRDDMAEPELVVVGVLVLHYERTSEKYRYFKDEYEFADEVGISIDDIRSTLAHLKEEGCIYVRKEYLGWKIGLKVNFIESLKDC